MDLMKAANMLRGMDDQMLMSEMQQPSGSIPQFMLMSEMKRRKDMRATQQKPVDTTPVADEMMNDPNNSGVASTPQMSQGAPAPMNGVAAFGAPQGFAGGGFIDYFRDRAREMDDFIGKTQQPLSDYGRKIREIDAKKRAEREAKEAERKKQATPIQPITPAPAPMAAVPQAVPAPVIEPAAPLPKFGPAGDRRAERLSMLYEELALAQQRNDPILAAATMREIKEVEASPASNYAGDIKSLEAATKKAAKTSSRTSSPAAPGAAPTPVGIGTLPPTPRPADIELPPPVARPQFKSGSDYLDRVKSENPDIFAPMIEANEKRLAGIDSRKKDAVNHALMAAGLGIMAGKSPSALTNIGEGGIMGLKQYTEGLREIDKDKATTQQHSDALRMAKQAASMGNFKLAEEIARNENQQATSMYGHDVADRRVAVSDVINQRNTDLGYYKADKAEGVAALREAGAYERAELSAARADARNERSISSSERRARIMSEDKRIADDTRRMAEGAKMARSDADRLRRQFDTAVKQTLSIDIQANPAKLAAAQEAYVMQNMDPELRAYYKPGGYTAPEQKPTWTLTPNGQWAQ